MRLQNLHLLSEYNVPARLQLLVLDFLTNRQQYVRTEYELSSTVTINTGAPQGCVLSAFLFIVYTNALSQCSPNCKILKYADDTVVIGLISNDNEDEYRQTISYVSEWCSNNYLNLNVSKTKEMILDMRKNKNVKTPVTINDSPVDIVPSYKYLGVTIQDNLKWNEHIEIQTKKANKRMYNVRRLQKLRIDSKILCLFYNSVISSVLVYAISSWYNACDNKLKKTICKFHNKVCKIVNAPAHRFIEHPSDVCQKKCISLINKIVHDQNHILHRYITLLPHGNLQTVKCRTERFRQTFLPVAIKLYNTK